MRTEEYPPPAPPAEELSADAQAAAADVNTDVPAHWTGAVIYCQPGCVPCAMQIRDLRKAGWKCGVGDGNPFKIIELLTLAAFEKRSVPSTPQTVYFLDGAEQPPRITGYGGTSAELTALVNRHPRARRAARVGTAMQPTGCTCLADDVCVCGDNCRCVPIASAMNSTMTYGSSPLWYEATSLGCSAPALSANCGAPAMASCAAPVARYSTYSIPATVSYTAPVYSAPPLFTQSGATIGPATHSAQLNLFGFPLIGGSIGTAMSW